MLCRDSTDPITEGAGHGLGALQQLLVVTRRLTQEHEKVALDVSAKDLLSCVVVELHHQRQ